MTKPQYTNRSHSDSGELSQELTDFILQHYRKILVLERNPANAHAIEMLLKGEGYNVTVATEKDEALSIAAHDEPDVMLVTEGVTADGATLRDAVQAQGTKLDFRILKDFGSAILGMQQGTKYSAMREAYHKALGLLITILEFPDSFMYKHTARVVSYVLRILERMDLDPDIADEIIYACYYHALPQLYSRLIDNAEHVPLDDNAKNADTLKMEHFLQILPAGTKVTTILKHLKERFDGKGYPDRLAGKGIPLGSRIIALVDIYMHMIQGGPDRKSLKRITALEKLQEGAGSAFDPEVVELFAEIVRKEFSEDVAMEEREEILIVDILSDDDLLKLKLLEEGYKVVILDDRRLAMKKIKESPPDLIVSEVTLPDLDGFQFLKAIKDDRETRSIPFLFVSEHTDASYITTGLRLGAEDYIIKPYNVEILFLKIFKALSRANLGSGFTMDERRGVSGSLMEMGILDIIQIMAAGSKTVLIHMQRASDDGLVYMQDGRIVNVVLNDVEGEDAFYTLLAWRDGEFVIHPDMAPPERNIYISNDMLLLKGMQKMDETRRQFEP
ncbi:response regulator [bacterium]|nr:response regulator [candidate division CSSED10-310 bacterium]